MAAKKGNPVLTKVFTIEKQNVDLQCFRAAWDKYNTYLCRLLHHWPLKRKRRKFNVSSKAETVQVTVIEDRLK